MAGKLRIWLAAVILLLVPSSASSATQTTPIMVFAAASLTDVMQDIGKQYEAAAGKRVVFSFAGSMILAKQIEASTGADLFISADVESMDYLDRKKLIAPGTRQNLLRNNLVLIAPADARITVRIGPGMDLASILRGGRLAVANVDTVPAGRYARAALVALGAWNGVKDRLAQGEDVRAALAYVARGEAPLGIVYATDARVEPRVRVAGTFPANTHEPILYPAALTKEARPEAAAFLSYLKGAEARAIFERAGFTVVTPGPTR